MIPEYNARGRIQARRQEEIEPAPRTTESDNIDRRISERTGGGELRTSTNAKKSVDVVFDLEGPDQAESLERHRTAFGEDHAEIKPLGDGKVVLKFYPGGARRLV